MNDTLRGELLHHVPRGQLVIVRRSQPAGNGFVRFHEAGKVFEAKQRFCFSQRQRSGIVARTQFLKRGRSNGAFEMKMQLRFGQAANEVFYIGHNSSLVGGPVGSEISTAG